jgi:arylsulfatase A-like enzyme
LALIFAGVLIGRACRAADRPNVVMILADDLGWGDTSCYGATKVRTPNIDRLAAAGVRFTDAHSPSSVCTPSRYNLLSGRYAWRTWAGCGCVWANDPMMIDVGRTTVASLVKSAGYHTACIGKWHLGFGRPGGEGWDELLGPDYNRDLSPGPLEVGFDYYFGVPHVGQFPHVLIEDHRVLGLRGDDPMRLVLDPRPEYRQPYTSRTRVPPPAHHVQGGKSAEYVEEDLAITLAHKAVAWIEAQKTDEPFFLYFAPRNIHAPLKPNARFRGTSAIGVYGDFINELDWSVGRVLDALDRKGVAERTLVIFSSDNGAVQRGRGGKAPTDGHTPNGPFRGYKTELYEGGHREPLLVRWPGRVKAGATSDYLVALTDVLATLSELLDKPLPRDGGEDSFSFLHVLLGRAAAGPVRESLVHDAHFGLYAIRRGPWKLLMCQGGGGNGWDPKVDPAQPPGQLYNIAEDRGETANLYVKHPEVVEQLTRLFERIRASGRSRP